MKKYLSKYLQIGRQIFHMQATFTSFITEKYFCLLDYYFLYILLFRIEQKLQYESKVWTLCLSGLMAQRLAFTVN